MTAVTLPTSTEGMTSERRVTKHETGVFVAAGAEAVAAEARTELMRAKVPEPKTGRDGDDALAWLRGRGAWVRVP